MLACFPLLTHPSPPLPLSPSISSPSRVVLRVDWVVSALDQWQLSEGAYSMGKTVFTCLLTMLLLPLAMSSVGNLIILYVCGEGSKHEKKL